MQGLFLDCGEILSAKIVRQRVTMESLGYGFVKFVDSKSATTAIIKKNGLKIGSKTLKVSLARPPNEFRTNKNCKIYVSNIPLHCVDEEVLAIFSQVAGLTILNHRNYIYL